MRVGRGLRGCVPRGEAPGLTRARDSIGANVKHLLERSDERYCFRLHKDRVYYVRCGLRRRAAAVAVALTPGPAASPC